MNHDYENIIHQFKIEGKVDSVSKFGDGLVNDTFIVITKNTHHQDYILQRINGNVFKNIPVLIHNKTTVSNFIQEKLQNQGIENTHKKSLKFIKSINDDFFVIDSDKNFWNLSVKIPESITYNEVHNSSLAFESGKAIGNFQYLLSDLSVTALRESFPNFHNLRYRINQLYTASKKDVCNRLNEVNCEIELVEKYKNELLVIDSLISNKTIPVRIAHYDTKISNVLFDNYDKAICMIDLDTVMPGISIFDFGDAIRSGTNNGKEDEVELEKISFNLDYFKKYAQGYIDESRKFITKTEINNLALSALYITFEQFVRFLTDYLSGDVYYKIEHKSHNIQRTKAQLRLFECMKDNYLAMQNIVRNIY